MSARAPRSRSNEPRARSNEPRSRNPQGEGARLRDELLSAARRVLAHTDDADGFSLRAVAREAGVAAPSVYLHFSSKDSLLRELVAAHFLELRAHLEDSIARATRPVERLRAGCFAYCSFATEQSGAYRILFGKTYIAAADAVGAAGLGMDAFAVLVDAVRACMATHESEDDRDVHDADPVRAATNVWAALHGIVTLRRAAPNFQWPLLEQQIDDLIAGLVLHAPSTTAPDLADPPSKRKMR